MMQEPPLIQDSPWAGEDPGSSRRPMAQATAPDCCRWLAAGFPDSRAAHSPLKPPWEGRGGWEGQRARQTSEASQSQRHPSKAHSIHESTLAPSTGGGLGRTMLWGPPAQQFYPDCRRHTPGESLFWGEGWGWPDNELQRSPTRPAHGEPPGWMCARPRHPPILQLARFASGGARS